MDFIFYKKNRFYEVVDCFSFIFFKRDFYKPTNTLEVMKSSVLLLTQWRTQNGCQQRAARQNRTELPNFSLDILAVSSSKQLSWFLIASVSNSKVNLKNEKILKESIILIQASSRQIIPFSMTLILILSNMPLSSQYSLVK